MDRSRTEAPKNERTSHCERVRGLVVHGAQAIASRPVRYAQKSGQYSSNAAPGRSTTASIARPPWEPARRIRERPRAPAGPGPFWGTGPAKLYSKPSETFMRRAAKSNLAVVGVQSNSTLAAR